MGQITILNEVHAHGGSVNQTPNYYVNVTADINENFETALIGSKAFKLTAIESVTATTSMLNLSLADGFGYLFSELQLLPDYVFDVKYGKSYQDFKTGKFKFSTLNFGSGQAKRMSGIQITSDMLSETWDNILKTKHSRSWKDVRYSDVVREIVDELGISEVEIEDTDGIYDVIQPNWTNGQLLRWICNKAVNPKGIGGYVFIFRIDGSFIFKTLDGLYDEEPVKTLNMASTNIVGDGISFFDLKNNYLPSLINGGFGYKSSRFDFQQGTFLEETFTPEDLQERQISDWYYIPREEVGGHRIDWNGIDPDGYDVSKNRISHTANSVQKLNLTISGDHTLRAGDMVDVVFPTSQEIKDLTDREKFVNDYYSGRWIIWKIAHNFDFANSDFFTSVHLIRNGLNGIGLRGLVKSSGGKKA